MASEMFLAVFGGTPESVTTSRNAVRANEPGEAVVTLQAAGGGTALLFVRVSASSGDERWVSATVVCESLQSGLRPEVATSLSVFPLARGMLVEPSASEAHAWGPIGRLRLVADATFLSHGFIPVPLAGEPVTLRLSVPIGRVQEGGVWATSPCRCRLTVTPDEYEVEVDPDGTVKLVETLKGSRSPDHFEFGARLRTSPLDMHRFSIATLSSGVGRGSWQGWRARLAAGNGVIAVEVLAGSSDEDATEEFEQTLPPERAR